MRRPAILLVVAFVAATCSDPTAEHADPPVETTSTVPPQTTSTTTVPVEPLDADLRAAQETWRERGPSTYRLWSTSACFGCGWGWIDLVADGEVVTHVPTATGGRSTPRDPGPRTMDDLYRLAMDLRLESHEVTVMIDDASGAIESIRGDSDEHAADDGYSLHFAVEPGETELPSLPSDVDLATLDEAFECGRQLGRRDLATGSAIHVHAGSDDLTNGTYWLSEKFPAWPVIVRTASDESGLGCEAEQWTGPAAYSYAVDGRLKAEVSQDGCFVRVTVTDLTIEDHVGERVNLGDITLTANRWGDCLRDG